MVVFWIIVVCLVALYVARRLDAANQRDITHLKILRACMAIKASEKHRRHALAEAYLSACGAMGLKPRADFYVAIRDQVPTEHRT